VVLPGLVLFAVWMSSRLTARAAALGASRAVVALTGACCVLALAIPALVTTLNPGLTAQPSVGRYSSSLSKLVSRVRLRGVGATCAAVYSIERAGRRPVLLGPTRSSVSLSGAVPRQVISLRTSGDAEDLTGAPAGTWPVTYSLWLAVPSGTGA
jgi:hypothetical protein